MTAIPTADERSPVRRIMKLVLAVPIIGVAAFANPVTSWADDGVTYEVVSDSISTANVEYQTLEGRRLLDNVMLPWRMETMVKSARKAPPDGAEIRADWRPNSGTSKWVTVRVYHGGKLVCQNTLDVGNAACYGVTPNVP